MTVFRVLDPQNGERLISMPNPVAGAGTPGVAAGQLAGLALSNLNGTSDPGATTDSGLGYSVGSFFFNATAGALRMWLCRDATAGAAKWAFVGADFANGGTNPSVSVEQMGNGTGLLSAIGTLNHQISSTGVNPGATGADNVVAAFSLPANTFDIAGRSIDAEAILLCAANTAAKTMKVIYNPATAVVGSTVGIGGTTLANTGSITTSAAAVRLAIRVTKYGAANSDTQLGVNLLNLNGTADAALIAPTAVAGDEDAAILIAVTANTVTATDVAVNEFLVKGAN